MPVCASVQECLRIRVLALPLAFCHNYGGFGADRPGVVSRGDLEDIIGANLACRAVSQQDPEPARDNDSDVARLTPFGSGQIAVVDRPPPTWLIHLAIRR
jgi:hypothetical protein